MNKKIIGIIVLMFATTAMVSATNINVKETIRMEESETVLHFNNKIVNNQPIFLDWGVDQEQTDNCGHGIVLTSPWTYAQSFKPTKDKLRLFDSIFLNMVLLKNQFI